MAGMLTTRAVEGAGPYVYAFGATRAVGADIIRLQIIFAARRICRTKPSP